MSNIAAQNISASTESIEMNNSLAKLKNCDPTSEFEVTSDGGNLADQPCNSFPKITNQITLAGDATVVKFVSPDLMPQLDLPKRSRSYVSVAKPDCYEVFIIL